MISKMLTLAVLVTLAAGCTRHIECQDGTRSPSCKASAPGCCAGHGGVRR